jgi:hypothetical protein
MSQDYGQSSLKPNGDITAATIVKQDASNVGFCLQAGSGDRPYGIATPATRRIALDAYDTALAGKAGDPAILIYTPGAKNVPLKIGGTVANGDLLKPNTNSDGSGITASADGDYYIARAKASGVSGDIIPVDVEFGMRGASVDDPPDRALGA